MATDQLAKPTTTPGPSALKIMASKLSVEPGKLLDTLKSTVFKGAKDEELLALVVVANEYKLNPLLKQIYAFPKKGGGVEPLVGIDGWLSIINQHKQFDGMDTDYEERDGKLYACRCTIYRKDRQHPISATEYYSECERKTEPWKNQPRRMLRHRAIIQTARIAFGITGISEEDEYLGYQERVAQARVIESEEADHFNLEPAEATPRPDKTNGGGADASSAPSSPSEDAADLLKAQFEAKGYTEGEALKMGVEEGVFDQEPFSFAELTPEQLSAMQGMAQAIKKKVATKKKKEVAK